MTTTSKVDFLESARRHNSDANALLEDGRKANAGHLFGFALECGLKALLMRAGVAPAADGDLPRGSEFRAHVDELSRLVIARTTLPDGRDANTVLSHLPRLGKMQDWRVGHRYWRESALPLASLGDWQQAAVEMDRLLDEVVGGRIL